MHLIGGSIKKTGGALLVAGFAYAALALFFANTSKADSSVIEINSGEQLAKIWNDPNYPENGSYILMQDLDLSGYGNWEPVYLFSGTFEGNGKTITGLTSDRGGLFDSVNPGAKIRNLTLTDVNINSTSVYIGALVDHNYQGTIENVSVIGGSVIASGIVGGLVGVNDGTITDSVASVTVQGENGYAGGMVGDNRSGKIVRSSASGEVTGGTNVGGFAGNAVGIFEEITATGNVSGDSSVGGLFGSFGSMSSSSSLSDARAEGDVSGNESIGGLIGSATTGSTVLRTQADGQVTAAGRFAGGLIGNGGGNVSESQSNGSVAGKAYVGGLTGMNSAGTITRSQAIGNVTGIEQVGGLAGYSSGNVTDSSSSGTVIGKTEVGGLIGSSGNAAVSRSYATGNVEALDTDAYKIGGLIGGSSATVDNSYAVGSVTSNGSRVGGLIGDQYYWKVANSYALGKVTGTTHVGGLIGYGDNITLEHAFAIGEVEGENNVGGLAGFLTGNATLTNNFATGQATGMEYVGGLVGQDDFPNSMLSYYSNVMAFGDVSGQAHVGGLAGSCGCNIDLSFAEGDVTASSGSYVGGLAGDMRVGSVKNSYASGKIHALSSSQVGGLVGYVANSVDTSYATGDVIADGSSYGGLLGSIAFSEFVKSSYYSGDVGGGNNLGKKLTEQQLKQIGQLQGFAFATPDSMGNPWLIVPGETTPFPRNGHAIQPVLQISGPIASVASVGDNLEFAGQVALDADEKAQYEDPGMQPLYVYYTIRDQDGEPKETKIIVRQPNPGAAESFNGSVSIDSTYSANQSYTLEIWAVTRKGGVTAAKYNFAVSAPAAIELKAELSDGSSYIDNEWTNRNVTVQASFENDIPSKRQYAVTGLSVTDPAMVSGWQSYVEPIELDQSGENTVWIRSENGFGGVVYRTVRVRMDKELPGSPTPLMPGAVNADGWASGPVAVTIADGTDTLSGVAYTEYKLGVKGTWIRYTDGISIGDEGKTRIYARTVDAAGNVGAETELEVKIDLTGPSEPTLDATGPLGPGGWASGPVTVTTTDGTDTLSGVAYTEYKIGASGTWMRYTADFQVSDEGQTKIYARTVDLVGHVGAEAELEVKTDLTAPTEPALDASGPIGVNGWASGPVTVTIADGTDTLSGVAYTEYKIGANGTWMRYTADFQVSDEGQTKIYARTVDAAGNVGAEAELEVKVDLTSPSEPTLNATGLSSDGWVSGPVTVTIVDGTDLLSGVDYTEYKLGASGTWIRYATDISVNDEGQTKIYARTVDAAGNIGAEAELEVKVDHTSPTEPTFTATGPIGVDDWASGPVTVTIVDGTDLLSGVDYTEYKLGVSGTWVRYTADISVNDEGQTKIYARTVDLAGQVGAEAELEVKVDLTGPSEPTIDLTGPNASNGADSWSVGPVTVTIADGLDALSGIGYTEYKIDSGDWLKYTAPFTIGEAYETTIYSRSVDKAGNIGSEQSRKATITSKKPTQPSSGGGGAGGSVANPEPRSQEELTLPGGSEGSLERDKTIFISIPAGATDRELKLMLTNVSSVAPQNPGHERISEAYKLSADSHERFLREITVSFDIDSSELKENESAEIFFYDEMNKKWVSIGGTVENKLLSANAGQSGVFAVFAMSAKEENEEEQPQSQSDMQGHWAETSVREAVKQGFVKGYDDGSFKPDQPVSRAEFIVMLAGALKLQGEAEELNFTDQSKIGPWAASAIAKAVSAGIVNGYGDGSFGPNKPVTRAEMAMMLTNAMGYRTDKDNDTGFADDGMIPTWAKGATETMRSLGIVNGRTGNKFMPNERASRAEAVTVILRVLKQLNEE